jgi:hypothetical protein
MSGVGRGREVKRLLRCHRVSLCAVHNVSVWTEYVASCANVADLPTDLKLAEKYRYKYSTVCGLCELQRRGGG